MLNILCWGKYDLKQNSVPKRNTVIISAFPGCGKSYAYNHFGNTYSILDSDSSHFSWIKDAEGNNTDQRNPDFPNNYIKHIKENLGRVDIIFVSSHDVVRQALKEAGLRYYIVYPSSSYGETFDNGSRSTNKLEFLKRYKDRGSPQMFIDMMDNNWGKFIDGIIEDKYPVHVTLNVDTDRKWIDLKLLAEIIQMEKQFRDFEKGDYKYGD